MPKPSAFIKAVRRHRLRAAEPSYRPPVDPQYHDLELAPQSGKKRDDLLAELVGDAGHTRPLLSATLPQPRSTLDSHALHMSSFVRLAIWTRPHYHYKDARRLRAIIHAEIALSAPADLDPEDPYRERTVPLPQMVMRLRALDVHLQPGDRGDVDYLTEALGCALGDQLLQHVNQLTSAVYSYQDDDLYGFHRQYRDLIRFELQAERSAPFVAPIMDRVETWFRQACQSADPHHELHEWLDVRDSIDLQMIGVDAAFQDAMTQGLTSRKSADKPKRPRAVPNAIHHLLIRTDPILRIRNGKVINLSRLAAMQTTASERHIEAVMDAYDLDDDEVDWGPSYDERLAAMKRNPDQERLKWVFVVDDGTQVFAAFPVPTSELSIDRIVQLLDVAWKGEMGLLRGLPVAVSLPTAYASEAARAYLETQLRSRQVGLTRPASGFATPLNVVKAWCERSAWIEPWQSPSLSSRIRAPATMSLQYLADWAYAHLLSNHANSYYASLKDRNDHLGEKFAFSGGGFGSMERIRVTEYLEALHLGHAVPLLKEWKYHCHHRFQSNYADPVD